MATLESSFRTFILQDPEITALIGVKFYWNRIPETGAPSPFVRASAPTDAPTYTQQGESVGKVLYQISIYSEDDAQCYTIRELFRKRLSGYAGALGDYNVRIFVKDVTGDWAPDPRLFERIMEAEVGYVRQ